MSFILLSAHKSPTLENNIQTDNLKFTIPKLTFHNKLLDCDNDLVNSVSLVIESVVCVLQYYCEHCWATIHSRPGREFHKPLVKEGADRPRAVPFRWC